MALECDCFADNLYAFKLAADVNERRIARIFGRKDKLLLLGIIINSLKSCLVVYYNSGDFAVVNGVLRADKNYIAIVYSCAHHRISVRA